MSGLLPLETARATILEAAPAMSAETVSIVEARGRVLAVDLRAKFASPARDLSAMDGYAARSSDFASGRPLAVVGEAPAGRPFERALEPGEAVRIFTGGWLPDGADAVLIQEDAEREGDVVRPRGAPPPPGRFVRPEGLDFRAGERLFERGSRLDPRALGLAAAAGWGEIEVRRRPRVAILSTGDELIAPGLAPEPGQIPASNGVALAAMIEAWGGEAIDLGVAPDDEAAIAERIASAPAIDLHLTSGGASVGAYDLVAAALHRLGLERAFWKIAMRPGKPLSFGALRGASFIGLPGNPVSASICAIVFVRPWIRAALGLDPATPIAHAPLAAPLAANDQRADHLRATIEPDGALRAAPTQDSSMTRTFATADALILRPPFAPAAPAGERVAFAPLAKLLAN